MKIKDKIKSKKSSVEELRKIREKISLEIQSMTTEQIMEYFNKQKTLHSAKDWQNI